VTTEPETKGLLTDTRATVIPCLRYRDAKAAIEWLCRAFGFETHLVVPGEGDLILHAQLSFGNGMVMLGSLEALDDIGGKETHGTYVIVSDADAVYARAHAAGATIVREIQDEDYGGRVFTCRDPEGHIWSFGTHDPWAPEPPK
jgi:uncharacterized glyoxalase superfamily protein PhnB